MASKKKIDIELNFTSNYAKLKEVEDALYDIQTAAGLQGSKASNELKGAAEAAVELQKILNSSWNERLGQLDLTKFNKSIKESFRKLTRIKTRFN